MRNLIVLIKITGFYYYLFLKEIYDVLTQYNMIQ